MNVDMFSKDRSSFYLKQAERPPFCHTSNEDTRGGDPPRHLGVDKH